MAYTKSVVCLAASWKHHGICVAGKELLGKDQVGEWIRPVSDREKGELSNSESSVGSGGPPKLLQVVKVPFSKAVPDDYQAENHLIAPGRAWVEGGSFPLKRVDALLDSPEILWRNGYSSSRGMNDYVPEEIARRDITSSLVLIQPETLRFTVGSEPESTKLRVRGSFRYKGVQYRFAVTDPVASDAYRRKGAGTYDEDASRFALCISLGEPLSGRCYKLIAGVIRKG